MPTYSFGTNSPLKFEIPDSLATDYNEYVAEFLAAQRRFLQKFGRRWDPEKEPIMMRLSKRHHDAIEQFGKVLASHVENDGRYAPNDIMDDFLVLNVVQTVAKKNRLIAWAVGLGALYGYLKAR